MASTSVFEDFDYLTAPALPSGWTVSTGVVTSTTRSVTASTSVWDNVSGPNHFAYTSGDSTLGKCCAASVDVWITGDPSSRSTVYGGIAYRASSTSLESSAITRMYVYMGSDYDNGQFVSFELNNGTVINNVFPGSGLTGAWFRLGVVSNINTHAVWIRRRSDGYYYYSGSWSATPGNLFAETNSTVASGQYFGMITNKGGGQTPYLDNFSYSAIDPVSSGPSIPVSGSIVA